MIIQSILNRFSSVFFISVLAVSAGCQPGIHGQTGDIAGSTTVTNSSGEVLTIDNVQPIYPVHGRNWNDYVQADGAHFYDATDTVCDPSTQSYKDCIHGGEHQKLVIHGHTSCSDGFSVTDTLGLFNWTCVQSSGAITFYSSLVDSESLASLVTPTGFRSNSYAVLFNGQLLSAGGLTNPIVQSPVWQNPVATLPDNSTSHTGVELTAGPDANIGKIYVATTTRDTAGYNLNADKIAVAIMPNVTLTGTTDASCDLWVNGELTAPSSGDVCIFSTGSQKFVSIEGSTANSSVIQGSDANMVAVGAFFYSSPFSRVRNLGIQTLRKGLWYNQGSNAASVQNVNITDANEMAIHQYQGNGGLYSNLTIDTANGGHNTAVFFESGSTNQTILGSSIGGEYPRLLHFDGGGSNNVLNDVHFVSSSSGDMILFYDPTGAKNNQVKNLNISSSNPRSGTTLWFGVGNNGSYAPQMVNNQIDGVTINYTNGGSGAALIAFDMQGAGSSGAISNNDLKNINVTTSGAVYNGPGITFNGNNGPMTHNSLRNITMTMNDGVSSNGLIYFQGASLVDHTLINGVKMRLNGNSPFNYSNASAIVFSSSANCNVVKNVDLVMDSYSPAIVLNGYLNRFGINPNFPDASGCWMMNEQSQFTDNNPVATGFSIKNAGTGFYMNSSDGNVFSHVNVDCDLGYTAATPNPGNCSMGIQINGQSGSSAVGNTFDYFNSTGYMHAVSTWGDKYKFSNMNLTSQLETLVMSGNNNTVTQLTQRGSADAAASSNTPGIASNGDNTSFTNVSLSHNGSHGIDISGSNLVFKNVTSTANNGHGFNINGYSNLKAQGLTASGNGGDGININSSDFALSQLIATDNGSSLVPNPGNYGEGNGVKIDNGSCSSTCFITEVRADANHGNGLLLGDGLSVTGVRASGNQNRGIYVHASGNGTVLSDVVTSSNVNDGIAVMNQDTSGYGSGLTNFSMNRVTSVSNGRDGINVSNSGSMQYFSNVVTADNGANGFTRSIYDTSGGGSIDTVESTYATSGAGSTISNLVSIHNGGVGFSIDQDAGDNLKFTGNFAVAGNTTQGCTVSSLTDTNGTVVIPGLVDTTCNLNSPSDATVNRSLASIGPSVVGNISTTDLSNTTNLLGAPHGSPLDLANFDNPYRTWVSSHIYDYSLKATDSVYRNTSDNLTAQNSSFSAGSACPSAVDGNKTSTTIDGRTFLVNAVEILGSTGGNRDGLCESGERCIYLPNLGAYQGHGTLGTCQFSDGNVTGVTLYGYPTNGR